MTHSASPEAPLSPFAGLTSVQWHHLAEAKRFLELLLGDDNFASLLASSDWETAARVMRSRSITHAPEDFAPFFQNGPTAEPSSEVCRKHPLAQRWLAFQQSSRTALSRYASFKPANASFAAWRQRQLARLSHELGVDQTTHYSPLLAFELSHGCSVQCSFCGFAAPKLAAVARYEDHALLWHELLAINKQLFGAAARESCLYHATEPTDNEGYLSFLQDFINEYGSMPQTTTAAPLRRPEMTRKLISMRRDNLTFSDRFSLLHEEDLAAVHAAFTPDELLPVSLLRQYGPRLDSMVKAGRNMDAVDLDNDARAESIECTCGFLINLPQKTITLISPCRATKDYPKGYRTHATTRFSDAASYEQALVDQIDGQMPTRLSGADCICLHEALREEERGGTTYLTSRHKRYAIGPASKALSSLLEKLQQGIVFQDSHALADRAGLPLFSYLSLADQLFQAGLLDLSPREQPMDNITSMC